MFVLVESRRSLAAGRVGPWFRFWAATFASLCLVAALVWLRNGEETTKKFELDGVARKDFLSASAARKDLDSYWDTLDKETRSLDSKSKDRVHHQQLAASEIGKSERATTPSLIGVGSRGEGKPATMQTNAHCP